MTCTRNSTIAVPKQAACLTLALALAVIPAVACTGAIGSGGTPSGTGNSSGSGASTGSGTGNTTGGGTGNTTGSGSGGAGTGTATGGSGTGNPGSGGGTVTGSGGISGGAMACPTTSITPTPLRRLTKFEYGNVVKDLLKVDPAPVADMPVDEITDGFNNNAGVLTVSSLHAEKYVLVAEALAKSAVKSLSTLTNNCSATTSATEDSCATAFAKSFGRRAFRRALTSADESFLMNAYSAGKTGGSYAEGIEVMIRAALQSPDFLYRLETSSPTLTATKMVPLSQYELATRLSFLVWGVGPDDALLDLAGRNGLGAKADVATKARDMLKDARAKVAITDFYNQWIGTNKLDVLSKSATLFPSYSAAVRDGMAKELPAFVQYVLWSGDHKIDTLLTSQTAFVTTALAPIYGVTAPSGTSAATTPQMVTVPATQGRSGLLTQAGFLAVQAHPDQTSPVLRGKFVRTKLMCQPPPPPPADANITPPSATAGGTARERFGAHLTAGSSCMACHQMMDPIGLAFENFDAVGTYRTTEAGKTIDVSGAINASADPALNGAFTGVRELGTKLAASDQVRDCVATQWFRFSAGRLEEQPDACSVSTLQDAFAASGGDLIELVVALTQTDAFWYRAPTTP